MREPFELLKDRTRKQWALVNTVPTSRHRVLLSDSLTTFVLASFTTTSNTYSPDYLPCYFPRNLFLNKGPVLCFIAVAACKRPSLRSVP